MKEFDYEKAKAGAPVCTRDGRPARIVCWDAKGDEFKILALITHEDGVEFSEWYKEDGTGGDVEDDLMIASVKHEGWINIYKRNGKCMTGDIIWPNIFDARFNAVKEEYITSTHIEWEE